MLSCYSSATPDSVLPTEQTISCLFHVFVSSSLPVTPPEHTTWNLRKGKDHFYLIYRYIPSVLSQCQYLTLVFSICLLNVLSFNSWYLLVLINFLKIWPLCPSIAMIPGSWLFAYISFVALRTSISELFQFTLTYQSAALLLLQILAPCMCPDSDLFTSPDQLPPQTPTWPLTTLVCPLGPLSLLSLLAFLRNDTEVTPHTPKTKSLWHLDISGIRMIRTGIRIQIGMMAYLWGVTQWVSFHFHCILQGNGKRSFLWSSFRLRSTSHSAAHLSAK